MVCSFQRALRVLAVLLLFPSACAHESSPAKKDVLSGYSRVSRRKARHPQPTSTKPLAIDNEKLRLFAQSCQPSHHADPGVSAAVVGMLDRKELVLPPRLMFEFKYKEDNGRMTTAVIPVVQHLFTVYVLTESAHIRQILLAVLRSGQSPRLHSSESLITFETADARPDYLSLPSGDILATLLDFDMRVDLELTEALLLPPGGYHVGAFYVDRDHDIGASYLSILQRSLDYAIGPYLEALHRATWLIIEKHKTLTGGGSGGGGGGGELASLENASATIVEELAEVELPKMGRKKLWVAPRGIYFRELLRTSASFRRLVDRLVGHITRGEPTAASFRNDSLAVDNELSVQLLRMLSRSPGFNISEIAVKCPFTSASVLHLIAAKNEQILFLNEVVDIARKQLSSTSSSSELVDEQTGITAVAIHNDDNDDDDDDAFVKLFRRCMLSTLAPWGSTPLHVAAMRWGNRSQMYQRLVELDTTIIHGAAMNAEDAFGLKASDYADNVYAFVDQAREHRAYDPFKISKGAKDDFLSMPKHRVVFRDASLAAASGHHQRSSNGGDGGWDNGVRGSVRLSAQTMQMVQVHGKSRIAEVEGLPTLAEFFMYLLQQRPIIFRNAFGPSDSEDHFGLRRTWSRAQLLATHGGVSVNVAEVPFAKKMDIRGVESKTLTLRDWVNSWYDDEHQIAKTLATSDSSSPSKRTTSAYTQVLSRRQSASQAPPRQGVVEHALKPAQQDSVRELQNRLAGDQQPQESQPPTNRSSSQEEEREEDGEEVLYLFSSKVMEDSGLLAETEPLQRYLSSIPGVTVMANQFFLGPGGSGAPTHYHQIAVNALAWGEKHWIVAPAKDSRRSDISAAAGIKSRLSWARENEDVVEFIQQAGDLVLLPMDYSHSTFNLRPSVGVASQVNFEVINYPDVMEFVTGGFPESQGWRREKIDDPREGDTFVLGDEGVLRPWQE